MKSLFFLAAGAVVLSSAACADAVAPEAQPRAPETAQAAELPPFPGPRYGLRDSIYTHQTPSEFLDAAPGWQVGTRFIPDVDGRFAGYRFYKAPGETGTHTARLYNSAGQLLHSATFGTETPSGWQRVLVSTTVNGFAGNEYYVTVNTNVKQAKAPGYFAFTGAILRNWGGAYGGAYGQPIHSFPSNGSASSFFVDVFYRPLLCDEYNSGNCY